MAFFAWAGRSLGSIWEKIRVLIDTMSLIRINLIMAVVGVAIVFNAQGQEVIRSIVDGHNSWMQVASLLAAIICALSVWYCARVMYYFDFDNQSSAPPWLKLWQEHGPRWLGAAVLLVIAAAWMWAGVHAQPTPSFPDIAYSIGTIVLVVTAVGFLLLVYRRSIWFKSYFREGKPSGLRSWKKLPKNTKKALKIIYIVFSFLGLSFIFVYLFAGRSVVPPNSTIALVLTTAAGLIVLGNTLTYWANRYRVPLVTLTVAWVLLCSLVNDNHNLRTMPESTNPQVLDHSLTTFVESRVEQLQGKNKEDPVPVVLVSAEGGGIRAAYWTALVLAELQDRAAKNEGSSFDFAEHVLAVSGVSGGSLGGATFAALVATEDPSMTYRESTQAFLSRDFLSPTVASMLVPDLLQRFLPFGLIRPDRAGALEKAWERAWECTLTDRKKPFSDAYIGLWQDQQRNRVPLLYLNSTVVETGQRFIVQPLQPESHIFEDALDAREVIGKPLPLSTAVLLSARFTYVSPAGRTPRHDLGDCTEKRWIRAVDGGYYENSGTATLTDIIGVISSDKNLRKKISELIIIHISNEPAQEILFDADGKDVTEDPVTRPPHPSNKQSWSAFMSETLSPVRCLLNTRSAHGYQNRMQLKSLAENSNDSFYHFWLEQGDVSLPLGWMLSETSQCDMCKQLLGDASKCEMCRTEPTAGTMDTRASTRSNTKSISQILDALQITGTTQEQPESGQEGAPEKRASPAS